MPTGCCIGTYLNSNDWDSHDRSTEEYSECGGGGLEGHDERVVIENEKKGRERERELCKCLVLVCVVVDWIDSKVVRLLTQPEHSKVPMHVVPVSLFLAPWLSHLFLGGGFVAVRFCLVCTGMALVSTSETVHFTVEDKNMVETATTTATTTTALLTVTVAKIFIVHDASVRLKPSPNNE